MDTNKLRSRRGAAPAAKGGPSASSSSSASSSTTAGGGTKTRNKTPSRGGSSSNSRRTSLNRSSGGRGAAAGASSTSKSNMKSAAPAAVGSSSYADDPNANNADEEAGELSTLNAESAAANKAAGGRPGGGIAQNGSASGGGEQTKDAEQEAPPSMLAIVASMFLNFWSAVGIIWCNKWIMNHGWRWATMLTWMHFVASFVGLEVSWRHLRLFEPKPTSKRSIIPLCTSFIAFVVFNNLSLQFNTVGIYQLLKVLMTPVVVSLQFCMHGTLLTFWQRISLVPICVGVAMATVSSLEVNGFLGLFFGAMGIFSTSLYQIWVKSKQGELQLNPFQLLHHQSYLSMIMLAPLAFLVDRDLILCLVPDLGAFGMANTIEEDAKCITNVVVPLNDPVFLLGVFTSCFLAYLVNLSTFLVIGKTSPVSYQVLGHSKLFVIMLSAFLMFGDVPSAQNILGCALALAGIFWYTWLKM